MSKLIIENLHASVANKDILKGVNLIISSKEVHAIMGPNGTGKSTLANVLMGHPNYLVTEGKIYLDDQNILELSIDERARAGLFLAMQYPLAVSGITNSDFMRQALRSNNKNMGVIEFALMYEKYAEKLKMPKDFPHRYLNEGFSGGEKKKNEIMQMKVLTPKIAIIDEIDSGLDVDALKIVGENIDEMVKDGLGCLLITHYQRILDYIKPTHVHLMIDGKIVKEGGPDLIKKIETEGYEWLKNDNNN